ncbi:photosystem I reaction center subunit IX [Nostoc sp. UHCC 0926]|nr:photosystem I reaction center subunit IX [Nostoc sp. UHCC 0926]WDD31582.1 photosystem I reaction center subunit IX [Nostoc sp. UHCC 0926]
MADKSDQSAYLIKFLSTAPVAATIWLSITAVLLIEINAFFPDLLFHPLP